MVIRQFVIPLVATSIVALSGVVPSGSFGQGGVIDGHLERVRLSQDGQGFILDRSGATFIPWGFNYDHDEEGLLLEDYWDKEWDRVVQDFQEMKALGANVVRIHLQVGRFFAGPGKIDEEQLHRLRKLFRVAEETGLYLDVTGLACYEKQAVPAWYDALDEEARWEAQALFWKSIAQVGAESPAVFCYDLMNEPVVPSQPAREHGWLVGPPFGGKYFVQRITLDPAGRPRHEIARSWVRTLQKAIREVDSKTLITIGLLPGTKDRADAWSGFRPAELTSILDFISVHIYPESAKLDEAMQILSHFSVGRPVVIEETFPLRCRADELESFLRQSRRYAQGWIGFYWGTPPEQLRQTPDLRAALVAGWLELFQKLTPEFRRP